MSMSPFWILLAVCVAVGIGVLLNWMKDRRQRLDEIIILTNHLVGLITEVTKKVEIACDETKESLIAISRDTSVTAEKLLTLIEKFIDGKGKKNDS